MFVSSLWLSEMETVDLRKLEFHQESDVWRKKKLKFEVSKRHSFSHGKIIAHSSDSLPVCLARKTIEAGNSDWSIS